MKKVGRFFQTPHKMQDDDDSLSDLYYDSIVDRMLLELKSVPFCKKGTEELDFKPLSEARLLPFDYTDCINIHERDGTLYIEYQNLLKKQQNLELFCDSGIKFSGVSSLYISEYGICYTTTNGNLKVNDLNSGKVLANFPKKRGDRNHSSPLAVWRGLVLYNNDTGIVIKRVHGDEQVDLPGLIALRKQLGRKQNLSHMACGKNTLILGEFKSVGIGAKYAHFVWNRNTKKWISVRSAVGYQLAVVEVVNDNAFIYSKNHLLRLPPGDDTASIFYTEKRQDLELSRILGYGRYIVTCWIVTGTLPSLNGTSRLLIHDESGAVVCEFNFEFMINWITPFMGALVVYSFFGPRICVRALTDFTNWSKNTHKIFSKHVRTIIRTLYLLLKKGALPPTIFVYPLLVKIVNYYLYPADLAPQ